MKRVHLRLSLSLSLLLWLGMAVAANAQTRAWLDRDSIALGETTTLNIETSQAVVDAPNIAALTQQFEIVAQSQRTSVDNSSSHQRMVTLMAYALRPRTSGMLTIPSLRVGSEQTQPLRLQVSGSAAPPVSARGTAFIEIHTDTEQPWVQQSVGYVVRLYLAVPVLSGTLEVPAPDGARLRQIGEDVQYMSPVGGRNYGVVERRFELIPERSGSLRLPAVQFRGQTSGNWMDRLFGDGKRDLSASGSSKTLQVRAPPADAPEPWLPLRSAEIRWLQSPQSVAAGQAAQASVEVLIDGAQAAQIPELAFTAPDGVQRFAEPAQVDESYVDGRPRLRIVQIVSLVAQEAGTLQISAPRLQWFDVTSGITRIASAEPLVWQVTPAATPAGSAATGSASDASAASARGWLWWVLGLFALSAAAVLWWRWPHLQQRQTSRAPRLKTALQAGDLAAIEHALLAQSQPPAANLDALLAQLHDSAQREAIAQLRAARWHGADTETALTSLRQAFAGGIKRTRIGKQASELLPPLYPR